MNNKETSLRLFLATGAVIGLTACSAELVQGTTYVTKDSVTVITDYNAPTDTKPKCTIPAGETAEYTGNQDTYLKGTSLEEPLVEIQGSGGCTGWMIDNDADRAKFEKKP